MTTHVKFAPNNPRLIVVVRDPVDTLVDIGREAGLKGAPRLHWALGVLLLLAL